jgi:hypothetical protein
MLAKYALPAAQCDTESHEAQSLQLGHGNPALNFRAARFACQFVTCSVPSRPKLSLPLPPAACPSWNNLNTSRPPDEIHSCSEQENLNLLALRISRCPCPCNILMRVLQLRRHFYKLQQIRRGQAPSASLSQISNNNHPSPAATLCFCSD